VGKIRQETRSQSRYRPAGLSQPGS
jgi:hypothetical protein